METVVLPWQRRLIRGPSAPSPAMKPREITLRMTHSSECQELNRVLHIDTPQDRESWL